MYVTYGDVSKMPYPYSAYLMFDGVVFISELALFFVMSRALSGAQWRRYYICVLALLLVDTVWIAASTYLHSSRIEDWMFKNPGFAVVIGFLLKVFRRPLSKWGSLVAMSAVIVRTTLDYYLTWSFYFPQLHSS